MRTAHLFSTIFAAAILLFGTPTAWGQPTGKEPVATRQDRLGKTIRIEDGGATIDETRLGGETQSIQVQPKGGMPRYEVLPAKGDASGGTRVWKVLGF